MLNIYLRTLDLILSRPEKKDGLGGSEDWTGVVFLTALSCFFIYFFFNKKRCHEDRKTTGKVREENRR